MVERINSIPDIGKVEGGEQAVVRETERIHDLVNCVAKTNVFGSDQTDEFQVRREDGTVQGMFKTWAIPIMPFVESKQLSKLSEAISTLNRGDNLLEKLPPNLVETLEEWSERVSSSPARLWQTMERFRVETQIADRRLTEIFKEMPLSEEPQERIAQLLARMHIAFGYAEPFYHIEAMVGDGQETPFNPASLDGGNGEGGALDLVALALPSAIPNAVTAERLNWNELSWEKIGDILVSLPESEQEIVVQLAAHLNTYPNDIIFAANVLEFIPVSVGGKKGDLPQDQAVEFVQSVFHSGQDTKSSVVRDMNALIRFLNWLPSIREQDNFDSGTLWNYAGVCDTAAQLLHEASTQDGVFIDGFGDIFKNQLLNQLNDLDANSAKGRFFLSLLKEGKFSSTISDAYERELAFTARIVAKRIVEMKRAEAIVDVYTPLPRALVGGKAAGVSEAAMVIPKENLVHGKVITSEWVRDWLSTNPDIDFVIQLLDKEDNPHIRRLWGQEIQKMIMKNPVPSEILDKLSEEFGSASICIRSSSMDEDTVTNGSAAGIYESEVDVPFDEREIAIQKVISSFFSQKALSYRSLYGFSDDPSFSIFCTLTHFGPGGSLFSSGNGVDFEIQIGASPRDIVDADNSETDNGLHDILTHNKDLLCKHVFSLEKLRNRGVDVEFIEERGRLILLQNRTLKKDIRKVIEVEHQKDIVDVEISSLKEIDTVQVGEEEQLRLHMGGEIKMDQFQGELFRWLAGNKGSVSEVILSKPIPSTCHFANICLHLGIKVTQPTN